MFCHIETFYIISAIVVGTVAVNVAIALIRKRLTVKSRVLTNAHWERRLDEDNAQEVVAQLSQIRRNRAQSHSSSARGYLNVLATRSHAVDEKKMDEEEMISEVEQALGELRQKYDEVTYLGKHTARGRENDSCLYARHRINGLSKCDGEIASLQRNKHTVLLRVNVHSSDATLIQEKEWGMQSPVSALSKLTTLCCATEPTAVVMPMPRTSEELQTVIVPILEAAICCVTGAEQLA